MKTLRLNDGDLVPGSGGVQVVTGPAKVVQDVRGALGEPLGNDRFHPGYGSILDDFIGDPLNESTAFEVEQEVNRVLGNYTAVQDDLMRRDRVTGRTPRYASSDVLGRVVGVDVATHLDTLRVTIEVQTLDRQNAIMELSVGGADA